MPFQPVIAARLSEAVVEQIELLILRGVLRPGERLPAERDLAERMGVSRPSLREALGSLQEKGLLEARAGAGVFVAEELRSVFPPALVRLFAGHREAVVDYIGFRRDLEGQAAERAAVHGTEADHAVIARALEAMEAAHGRRSSAEEEAELDAGFHMAILEAAHNVVLLHMMRAMFGLLREGVFYNRQIMFRNQPTRSRLLEQHRSIAAAILGRDPAAARAAVEAHLDFVEQALAEQVKAEGHEAVARQRLEKMGGA
ncbi:FCD domain-containing protein [Oceanicola sp. D3]|uniref:FadR/GntR family transcriptional regulator n=1 Tax=Oceanicola sp. D3 TaxID=2587163 RepID=UPI0011210939|nr:FCD domain-containing protein [Oceanicola sp. D3]QDC08834.1 FCD domain-containing protein [Oceanicola sp. D3]